ncbi:hypothetical protein ACH5RR_003113 [Cinchona calisaya]|uniref:Uncharacterized protein n=1 Tax=Cinchona calisaya TaxID=153742 RepID=A0ABD3ATV1_9GENT
MSSTSVFTSSQSQKRWRDHMKHNYTSNHSIRPCVLQVPDNLRETKPEAYTPQHVGLGPYHHFRAQVQHMESQKRAAVIYYLAIVNTKDFIELVEKSPADFEPIIRSCYDRYLDLDKETLSWVVIADAIFLLQFINTYLGSSEEKKKVYSNIEAVVADILMLENQIPIILILEMRKFLQQTFTVNSDEELFDKFHRLCKKQSPLILVDDPTSIDNAFDKKNHMLHFMYQLIVKNKRANKNNEGSQDNRAAGIDPELAQEGTSLGGEILGQAMDEQSTLKKGENKSDAEANKETKGRKSKEENGSRVVKLAQEVATVSGVILDQAIEEFNSALSEAKSAGIKVHGNIEKVSNILRNLQRTLHLDQKKDSLADQIDMPSASRLKAILKIEFEALPNCCGIGDIYLDENNKILYLPVITLRANSEVILRNLAAYEATSKLGSTQIRDYVDLMCGIIKSEKDVKLLKDSGIIDGELLDGEIVKMCNAMTKSDEKPDEQSKAHITGKQATDLFHDAGIVKACKSIMKCLARCVKYMKPLFAVLVLLFLALQSFCEIFDCRRRSSYGGAAFDELYAGALDAKARLMLPRKVYRY